MLSFLLYLIASETETPWPTAQSGTPSYLAILFSCLAGIGLIALSVSYLCCTKQPLDQDIYDASNSFFSSQANAETALLNKSDI